MVLQDTWLFQGTIEENVAYAREDATLEEVIDVCKKRISMTLWKRCRRAIRLC